jgi:hypothetical protein
VTTDPGLRFGAARVCSGWAVGASAESYQEPSVECVSRSAHPWTGELATGGKGLFLSSLSWKSALAGEGSTTRGRQTFDNRLRRGDWWGGGARCGRRHRMGVTLTIDDNPPATLPASCRIENQVDVGETC